MNCDHFGVVNTANDKVFAKETEENGEKCLHPKKRKRQSSEDPQDPLRDEKTSKTVVTFFPIMLPLSLTPFYEKQK